MDFYHSSPLSLDVAVCGHYCDVHVNAVRVDFQDLPSSLLSCHEIDNSKGCFPTVCIITWEFKEPFQTPAINRKSAQTF